ncbi:MAG: hypothetical protein GX249_06445 [Firmicutes bacterium]|jgi:hypothetical protein|nr:hypothetical protein [Bacillota bacterium]
MRTPIVVPDQFVLLIEGKPFVLYAGLLLVAQEEGIKELSVSIEQIPSVENGHTAIASAKAVTSDGSVFVDVGDASPVSVGADKFVPHLLRIASTRAKARVLRDAYAIAMTSVEELIPDRPQSTPDDGYNVHQTRPTLVPIKDEPATDKQMMVLHSMALQLNFNDEDIAKLDALNKAQASQAITELSARVRQQKGEQRASSL